jgi:hypothetical protein
VNDKVALVKLGLELVNRIGADGFEFRINLVEGAPVVSVRLKQGLVGSGALDGILVDDVQLTVSGVELAELLAPGPHLLDKLKVDLQHVAVRISRDWLNMALAKDPKLRELGVESAAIVFPESDTRKMVVRVSRPPVSFEVQILFGIDCNRLTITIGGIQFMGFLPVPAFVTNMVFSFVESKVRRPGLALEGSTVLVEPLKVVPLPVDLNLDFRYFGTRGRFLVIEMGSAIPSTTPS